MDAFSMSMQMASIAMVDDMEGLVEFWCGCQKVSALHALNKVTSIFRMWEELVSCSYGRDTATVRWRRYDTGHLD